MRQSPLHCDCIHRPGNRIVATRMRAPLQPRASTRPNRRACMRRPQPGSNQSSETLRGAATPTWWKYQEFPRASTAAKMDVEVEFDASSGKSFPSSHDNGNGPRISFLDKVLKASTRSTAKRKPRRDKGQTALCLGGSKLSVSSGGNGERSRPVTARTYWMWIRCESHQDFFIAGRIWVDSSDFARW